MRALTNAYALQASAYHILPMGEFRKLRVWQGAEQLAVNVYRTCVRMRGKYCAKLADQLIRAAMSVPINIVEGNAHESPKEFARFLQYSLASAWEVEAHLQLGVDLGMISKTDYATLVEEVIAVRRQLYGLIRTLRGSPRPQREARSP